MDGRTDKENVVHMCAKQCVRVCWGVGQAHHLLCVVVRGQVLRLGSLLPYLDFED